MKHPADAYAGSQLRKLRRLAGMTQEQLADKCGCKFQQIQKYETGMNRISVSRLTMICEALDAMPDQFFDMGHDTATAGVTLDEVATVRNMRKLSVVNHEAVLTMIAALLRGQGND